MSYYKTIDGNKYDGELLDLATKLTTGTGESKISQDEAKQLFEKVRDGNTYTDVEKQTVEYIRKHFAWTPAADAWFRSEVRIWAATKTK
jgi:hypothetical protein